MHVHTFEHILFVQLEDKEVYCTQIVLYCSSYHMAEPWHCSQIPGSLHILTYNKTYPSGGLLLFQLSYFNPR